MTSNLLAWSTAISNHWWSWSEMQSTFISTSLPNFSTSSDPFTLQASINHKINQILLISLQILTKTFFSNTILISHTIWASIYSLKCLKTLEWVVYINTLFSPRIAWIGIESCSNYCLSQKQPCILRIGTESLKMCIVLAVRWSVK